MIDTSKYKKLKLDAQKDPHLVQVYAIYDKAAGFFNPPYCSNNAPEQEILHLKRAAMNNAFQYPNDLELYLVGIFDTNLGSFAQAQTYQVGSLYIGDFARKETKKHDDMALRDQAS